MRTRRPVGALAAGVAVAFAVSGLASAANTTIAAKNPDNKWQPETATIHVGDSVTWTNDIGYHNVCVASASAVSGCGEYRSGEPTATWPSGGYSHQFTTAGTYGFICEVHDGMTGTITVEPASTGTGTTTPPPETMPTDTTTVPTQTQTTGAPAADTIAPAFTGKLERRVSRQSLTLGVGASERATLKVTVVRRPSRGRSFTRVGDASLTVKQGRNVVAVPRKARGSLRSGSYKVMLQLVDAGGNKSAVRTLSFKLA